MDYKRIVEIYNDDERTIGSGYLISNDLILTAYHVVNKQHESSKDFSKQGYSIRFIGDFENGNTEWRAENDGASLYWFSSLYDLALLKVNKYSPRFLQGAIVSTQFGKLPTSTLKAEAYGFPQFKEFKKTRNIEPTLVTVHRVTALKQDRLSLLIDSLTPIVPEAWSGMSGAAVFVGNYFVGVITEVDKKLDGKVLWAVPISLVLDKTICNDVFPDFKTYYLATLNSKGQALLTWDSLHKASKDTLLIKEKTFNSQLYVQRNQLLESFKKFLNSEKTSYILIGKSGVGKSSFINSLWEEYRNNFDVCLLIYKANILNPHEDLFKVIERDLNHNEVWRESNISQNDEIDLLFKYINEFDDIQNKKFILAIDGINENVNPKIFSQKLSKLLALVEKYNKYWFKLVLTCRPESWKSISKHIWSDKIFYQEERLVGEYQNFSYQLQVFNSNNFSGSSELKQAYQKYKKVYRLHSKYIELSRSTLELIRDPFELKIISEAYKGKIVPNKINPISAFIEYLNALVESDRINQEDLHVLSQEIIPQMISGDEYKNYITYDFNKIEKKPENISASKLNNINNLLDAEILEKVGRPTSYRIIFKYERVYEYFVADYIITRKIPIRYDSLITKMSNSPWLWGVVIQVLVGKLLEENQKEEHQVNLLVQIAITSGLATKDILVSTIQEYSRCKYKSSLYILQKLVKYTPSSKQIKQYHSSIHQNKILIRRIAIETAYSLKMSSILLEGAKDSSNEVRSIAIQNIWSLCRQEEFNSSTSSSQDSKEILLQKLRDGILKKSSDKHSKLDFLFTIINLIIYRNTFDSFFRISLLLYFENFHKQDFKAFLKNLWDPFLLPFLKPIENSSHDLFNKVLKFIQSLSFKTVQVVMTASLLILLKPNKESNSWFNTDELSLFFKLPQCYKDIFFQLIPYLNTDTRSLQSVENEILTLSECKNVLIWYFLDVICVRHTVKYPKETIELLQKVFDKTIKFSSPPPPSIILVRDSFRWALKDEELMLNPDEYIIFLKDAAIRIMDMHSNCIQMNKIYIYSFIEVYHYIYYKIHQELDREFIRTVIEKLKEKSCGKMYRGFLCEDIPYIVKIKSIPSSQITYLLAPFLPLLKDTEEHNHAAICDSNIKVELINLLIESLSMIRALEEDIIDNLLIQYKIPTYIQMQVKDRNIYNFNNFFAYQLTKFGTENFILKFDKSDDLLYKIFHLCSSSKNLYNWFSMLIKLFLIFGIKNYSID